jgi:LysR family transcriptional regulator, nod-box dependent transcriptional activator
MSISIARFDLNLLLVLDALLTEQSVTKAAKRLFVSQPAVSASLQRLREIFDDQLLVRVGRQMELTARGKSLAAPVHDALMNIQQVLNLRQDFDPATARRTFRISMSDYCAITLLPRLVRRLAREASGIGVVVEPVGPESIRRLESGDLDLCVIPDERRSLGTPMHPEMLLDQPLYEDRFVCVVAADHPLSGSLTLKEYESYPHAKAFFGDTMVTIYDLAYDEAGVASQTQVQVPNFSSLLFQLPATKLIATVPLGVAEMLKGLIGLKSLHPPIELPILKEKISWHLRYEADPAHRWLREQFVVEARLMKQGAAPAAP